uniref:F-box/kelch-repeat protein n=1 Tax=Zea mays TaxID=4577 RepID=A0A804LTV0_MAIZE
MHCSVLSIPLHVRYKLPFGFLPPWDLWLVGSSGGLVCFSGFNGGASFRTVVCNPLTRAWRDSKENKWSVHQMMPATNLCSSKMAFYDSRLYLDTLSPLGLMMYIVDAGRWEHIPAKFPRSLLDGYLVAGACTRTVWVEISRMPPRYFRALLRLSSERFECFGQDNLICFTSWNQGKGLLYDVDKKSWSWITGCASQLCNSQVCFYEPRHFNTKANADEDVWDAKERTYMEGGGFSCMTVVMDARKGISPLLLKDFCIIIFAEEEEVEIQNSVIDEISVETYLYIHHTENKMSN